MPRYLVTLRHAETGDTRTMPVVGENIEDAMFVADEACASETDCYDWRADHACPADDVPVPGRDR